MNANVLLPEGLREALGQVIANERREWRRERELIQAQAGETIANLRITIVQLENEVRSSISERLASLKDGKDGLPGENGRDGLSGQDGKDGAAGSAGQDGTSGLDGVNGKDADPVLIASMVKEAFAALPVPQDGRDGVDGLNGKDGEPGKSGADGAPGIIAGRDGRDGMPGFNGKDGEPGLSGKDGLNGLDGSSGEPAFAPDDTAERVSKAIAMLAETPVVGGIKEPPMVLNINSAPERPRKMKKTITTRRDGGGNLIADVVEQEIA